MSVSNDPSAPVIYRAPWIAPVTSPVIADGAVLVQDNRICAVSTFREISQNYPDSFIHDCSGVLMPGLVNAHIHLELSVFGTITPENENSNMCDWIRLLLQKRMESGFSESEIFAAAGAAVQDQYASGVVLLLDTGNKSIPEFSCRAPEIYPLLEMLGPSREVSLAAIKKLDALPETVVATGHAPYSTSPELLQCIKKRSCKQGAVFSLHVAESPDEAPFLLEGTGSFYEFLSERGGLNETFPLSKYESSSVIDYLHKLRILDTSTLCVHCVHVTSEEIKILAGTKSHVCLCPGSNRFLGVGKPPLEELLQHEILPALGTDSIASNPVLDIWREMALIRDDHPNVAPQTVLSMATLGGARAMHRENDYGSLQCGRSANFINVHDDRISEAQDGEQLLDVLTTIGRPDSIVRICE